MITLEKVCTDKCKITNDIPHPLPHSLQKGNPMEGKSHDSPPLPPHVPSSIFFYHL